MFYHHFVLIKEQVFFLFEKYFLESSDGFSTFSQIVRLGKNLLYSIDCLLRKKVTLKLFLTIFVSTIVKVTLLAVLSYVLRNLSVKK